MNRIGNRAKLLLEETHNLRIHSVFRNSINIGCRDDYLVTLLPETYGCGPLAVSLDCECYDRLRKTIGAEGTVFDAAMLGDFGLAETESFILPDKLHGLGEVLVRQNLKGCRKRLADIGKLEGAAGCIIGMESLYSLKFKAAMDAISICIRNKASSALAEEASSIIGLGPGLTPSGDDFLYGLFGALFYGSRYKGHEAGWIKSALELLLPFCRQKTTIISYNMLRTCVDAEFSERMIKLLTCMVSGPQQELERSFDSVIGIGGCSGSDMAAGVIFGLGTLL